MAHFSAAINAYGANFKNALAEWSKYSLFQTANSNGTVFVELSDLAGTYTSPKAADGTITITLNKNEFETAINSGDITAIRQYGTKIFHELIHATTKAGMPRGDASMLPSQYADIGLAAEAYTYTQQFLFAKSEGVSFSNIDPTMGNNLESLYQQFGSSSQFQQAAQQYIKTRLADLSPSNATNIKYPEYYKDSFALLVTGIDVSRVDWTSISTDDFSYTGTSPSRWGFSVNGITTKGGEINNLSVQITQNENGIKLNYNETFQSGSGPSKTIGDSVSLKKGARVGAVTPIALDQVGSGKSIVSISSTDSAGNVLVLFSDGSQTSWHIQPSQAEQDFAFAANQFGSALGRLLGGGSLVLSTAAGSVLSAAALSIAQAEFKIGYYPNGGVIGIKTVGTGSIWADFNNNLSSFGINAGIGAVSGYLSAELAQAIGLHGFAAQSFSFAVGNVLSYVATQVAAGASINAALSSVSASSFGNATSIGGFIGTQLASLVVQPHTAAEATLASLGGALGAYLGTKASVVGAGLAGPVGAAVGAFVGYIVGDLIGSLFGHHTPRIPSASAETVLEIPFARYGIGVETASGGGDLALADSMASAARDALNGIIEQVTGKPVGAAFVANGYSPTQKYGYSNGQIYVKLNGVEQDVASADQAVDKGVLWALPQTKIIGGDIFLKRAIQNGQWQSATELLGDLQVASDYEKYLTEQQAVDAAISSSWNNLSPTDKDFYGANQAFMTRAISMTQLPLQGGDVSFYNANKAQVDRIISSISVSTFAAGWITTIARATELKLDQFGPSDFYGGMAGFVQSFGVAATQTAEHYEDIAVASHTDGSVSITARGGASTGTFSLLPQKLDGPNGNDVYNPRFQQGAAGWERAVNYGPVESGVNLPGWSGSGNDVLWSHMGGTPPSSSNNIGLIDYRSEYMPSIAGHLYEASVWAAEHRSLADVYLEFDDTNRNTISYAYIGSGGRDYGSGSGDLNNYDLFRGLALAPAGTAYRRLLLRNHAVGGADPFTFFTRPESHDETTTNDLANPRFLDRLRSWNFSSSNAPSPAWGTNFGYGWSGSGNDSLWMEIQGTSATNSIVDTRSDLLGAQGGANYQVSVLAAQHRGYVQVWVDWFDANAGYITSTLLPGNGRDYGGAQGDPANYNRINGIVTAPSNAAYRGLVLRVVGNGATDAFGFFEQPIFRPATGASIQNWSDMPSDYQAGGSGNWDATGQSALIANFGASVGYNTT
ncbi:hypothetical protein [Sphingomonas sp. MMS24-J13]|uniref:hypothetical protein n=1 Tax=Sphingomonas sp. MMS24-J13 TaxID=3238686 RepID=UPI00384EADBE